MIDDSLAPLLEGFPVVVETPVAWGDMDFFRHVNNTVFFRYFESARIEYRVVSEKLGAVAAEGGGIVVAYDYRHGRKAPLPEAVSRAVRRLER
jgi:acyl-CoA thioester hydrolase